MGTQKNITVVGAGLVGSLVSIYLAKRGYKVDVYERRPDMRKANVYAGRSINLALSDRGWRGLEGVGIADEIKKIAIPMYGHLLTKPMVKIIKPFIRYHVVVLICV
jgi:kynurenine 3-monooxygenase